VSSSILGLEYKISDSLGEHITAKVVRNAKCLAKKKQRAPASALFRLGREGFN
jgi:hypothetical protein